MYHGKKDVDLYLICVYLYKNLILGGELQAVLQTGNCLSENVHRKSFALENTIPS